MVDPGLSALQAVRTLPTSAIAVTYLQRFFMEQMQMIALTFNAKLAAISQ